MLEGFVGGIGLIILGLLVAWLNPHIVKSIRSAVDDALPAATAPPREERPSPPATGGTVLVPAPKRPGSQ
jgi:hypothetical protein